MPKQKISPCLWFDDQAEEAVRYYSSIFKNSKTTSIARYTEAGREVHGRPPGSILTISFELDGQQFTALNGGPHFKFTEAISLQVDCKDQAEVDYFWDKLSAGGDPSAQQCGWLKDKFGLSWQVVPMEMFEKMMSDPDPKKSGRAMTALLQMKKIDIAAMQRAYAG